MAQQPLFPCSGDLDRTATRLHTESRVATGDSKTTESSDPPAEPDSLRSKQRTQDAGAALWTRLTEYMDRRGLRLTGQRRAILTTIINAPEHSTLDELLETVRKTDKHIGYATVYRTMKMLTEAGVVEERKFGDGYTRYEISDESHHHDHLICQRCGHITEFEEPLIEELQDRVAQRHGFKVTSHRNELYGMCRKCCESTAE